MNVNRLWDPQPSWQAANQHCLNLHLQRLRLLLQRRALWLRQQWQHDLGREASEEIISDAHADWLLRGEDVAGEMRFYAGNPAAVELGQAMAAIERELAALTEEMGTRPASLEVITHLFHLTPFERDVLLLCLAPDLDPSFETLYAYTQDDGARRAPTAHLALSLFSTDAQERHANRERFASTATLRRYHLVNVDGSETAPAARPLYLDERIGDYLRGVNRPDARIADLIQPLPSPLLASMHRDLVERCIWVVKTHRQRGTWPVLNLVGLPDSGQKEVARALGDRLNIQVFQLDLARIPTTLAEQRRLLALLGRETVLLQITFYVDATDLDDEDKMTARFIDDLLERSDLFAIVASRQQWSSERSNLVALTFPRLDSASQIELWEQALNGRDAALDGQLAHVVQQFHFGPQSIVHTVASATNAAQLRTLGQSKRLQLDDLWQACRQQSGWRLDELAQRIEPGFDWDDIVVPRTTRQQMEEIAAQVMHRHQVYETWGFSRLLSRGRGISALFAGPSGTGKTMAAEILANELDLTLYRIDLAGVVSKYIGETEKNLRRLFEAAEESGAILFFDEADALFGQRTEVRDSHDRYANIETDYLLQSMETYRGLAILATNRRNALDRAFLRRLRFVVEFPFPNADSRRRIWQKMFPPGTPLDRLDYNRLAQLEIAGGNIRNVALNAAFLAAAEGVKVGMAHIRQAARREYAKLEKLETEVEFAGF